MKCLLVTESPLSFKNGDTNLLLLIHSLKAYDLKLVMLVLKIFNLFIKKSTDYYRGVLFNFRGAEYLLQRPLLAESSTLLNFSQLYF